MRIQKKSSVCLVFFSFFSQSECDIYQPRQLQSNTKTDPNANSPPLLTWALGQDNTKKNSACPTALLSLQDIIPETVQIIINHPSGSYNRPFGITVLTSRYDLILLFALNILHDDNTYNQATNIKHHHIEQFGSASPISYVLSSYYTRTEAIKRKAAILKVPPPLLPRLICADRPS